MYDTFQEHVSKYGNKNTQLDRIDNDGDYYKDNCRWTTVKKNCRNKGQNRMITFNRDVRCVSEWGEYIGGTKNTVWQRLNSGWSIEKAITTPVRKRRKKNDPSI